MKSEMIMRCSNFIYRLETVLFTWLKKHIRFILLQTAFGMILYFMLLSGNLVNDMDGIWNTSNFVAGNWEISLGRGLLRYFDKLRFGVVSVPLNSVLMLLILAVANSLLVDLLSFNSKVTAALAAGLLIGNPVVCASLSYCYTSVNFGLAYFFSVAAVFVLVRTKGLCGIACSSLLIALSMGCYQAYFGVTCLLLLTALIQMLMGGKEGKEIKNYVIKGVSSILIGGVIYFVLTKLLLLRAGVSLASYRGASEVSLSNILIHLPDSFLRCYQNFYRFFFVNRMYCNISGMNIFIIVTAVLLMICVLWQFMLLLQKKKGHALGFLACILLIPAASNAVLIIAAGNSVSLQMAMSMIVSILLLFVLLPTQGKGVFYIKRCCCLLVTFLFWGSIAAVSNDQLALKEGTTATVHLANRIINVLDTDGYIRDGSVFAFMGKPSENDFYIKRTAYLNANEYARFGGWWSTEAENHKRSWQGVLSEYCGIRLNLCSGQQYQVLIQNKDVANMPVFPLEGSIAEIDGVIVIKVSDFY